jgi:regulator of protease activity HflC (stomatin/prohibitin superfamily)
MIWIIIGIIVLAVIIIAVLIALIAGNPWYTVEEQQAAVVQRLGKFKKVDGPGLHWRWPMIESIRQFSEGGEEFEFVDQRERSVDLPAQSVITKDNVQLDVDSMAYYQITDPQKAVYNVTDVVFAVNQLIKTVLRDVIGDTSLQQLLSGREEINEKLREQVARASGDWGITIRSVELQSVTPPPTYVDAMRRVSEAELAKKAAITEAEGKKMASILEAEGEAEKINKIYSAIHEGNPNDELLKIKYLEALEKIADGKSTKVFMPFPANPSSGNFFQQAFGMAAGLDAYNAAPDAAAEKPSSQASASQQQTTPITKSDEKPRKKIIRRVVKRKPPDTDNA